MQVYLLKRVVIDNTDGETIDEISNNCAVETTAFSSLENCKSELNNLYENDKEYLLYLDPKDGYYEDSKSDIKYHIQVWDEYGVGVNIDCSIEVLELH